MDRPCKWCELPDGEHYLRNFLWRRVPGPRTLTDYPPGAIPKPVCPGYEPKPIVEGVL